MASIDKRSRRSWRARVRVPDTRTRPGKRSLPPRRGAAFDSHEDAGRHFGSFLHQPLHLLFGPLMNIIS
jgi:hypothetical protein